MIPRFETGEVAVICKTDLIGAFYMNMECTICCLFYLSDTGMPVYHIRPKEVAPEQVGHKIICPEFALRKTYDGDKPAHWDHSRWMPKQIRNKETLAKIAMLKKLKEAITEPGEI